MVLRGRLLLGFVGNKLINKPGGITKVGHPCWGLDRFGLSRRLGLD